MATRGVAIWTGSFTIDDTIVDGDYTITLSGATDLTGNAMTADAGYSISIDADRPEVVTFDKAGATGVGVLPTFTITFSEPVQPMGVENNLVLTEVDSGDVIELTSFSWSPDGKTVTFVSVP